MKQWFKQRRALWAGLIGLLPAIAHGQQRPVPDTASLVLPLLLGDTARVQLQLQPDSLAAEPVEPSAIDSARLLWLRTPPTMRELVCDRVGCFETEVPHQFNNSVMAYVTLFTARNRSYMQRVLERENFYFPIFEKYLAQYSLPTDLKYLAVVESALIPTAKSPVGATGLWQFMGPTAGDLRLKRDEWVDERMAPEKATEAACKHLRYLYGIFHDWELVLAAYNWGAGNVQRVMRRSGQKKFWDLYPYMPAETRNYVPTFTAIMYSMKYAQLHGLHSDKLAYQYAEPMDTLGLRGQSFDLRRLSRACGYTDSLYLARFNPELRRAALPAGYRPYVVRYPASAREHLGEVGHSTLVAFCQPASSLPQPLALRPVWLAGVEPFPTAPVAAAGGPRLEDNAEMPRFRRLRHAVRRGETLAVVAEHYDVSQAQLRRWNELPKGKALKPGRKLVVFVPLPAAPKADEVAAKVPVAAPPVALDEAAVARRELAAANARETARLAAIAEQERRQEATLAKLRQRQTAAQRAAEKLAAAQAAAQEKAAIAAQVAAEAAAARKSNPPLQEEPADSDVASVAPHLTAARPQKPAEAAKPMAKAEPAKVEAAKAKAAKDEPYTVRKGEYLTKLARENDVTVAQLVAWNHLESETVVPGQKLLLQAPAGADRGVVVLSKAPAKPTEKTISKAGLKPTHTVEPGDTLYNISRRFGVSVEELRRLNHLSSDEVKLGQKLLVGQG